jgi:hypothetical protein
MYKRGQQFEGRATYSSRDKMNHIQGKQCWSGERLFEGGPLLLFT